ncbi:hypothetical protein SteCoe_19793 [Stentor coeruleus]|uniref:NAD-dependent epimerase/dehydratase domain-containing protein n=1 Tax=Stentor coeruleus TaxID=5963 RepID=A0A1R2BT80_9CILI|nr:hypothetical protein SteCoe_19793 [Stentor coeruleus]
MRIFLTGATGSIGGGILHALAQAGHQVTCVVRNIEKASSLKTQYGDLVSLVEIIPDQETSSHFESLASGFHSIIHSGYAMSEHDKDFEQAVTSGLLSAARKTSESSPVTFVFTTGAYVLGETDHLAGEDETSSSNSLPFNKYRVAHEEFVLSAQSENLHISIVRPTWVYGESFVEFWFKACKTQGKILASAKEGHVTFIHKHDLGELYRLIVENSATGFFAGSEGQSLSTNEIIELAKRVTGVNEVERVENVWAHIQTYGFFIFSMDFSSRIDCKRGRELLGFAPKYNLLRDAERVLKLD